MKEELEEKIKSMVSGILNITDSFDINEGFIQLGADSMFFAKLQIEIKRQLGKRLPLKVIFSNASVSMLADEILGESL
ncbi:Phosphopantetheine attachment site [Acetitomaculum ruminis DSM 5522]|uniref:Phosphopantetheine attachment site n=1 Tax=Acetitomaculum ruminis DSM 5522 TaxID=1120918 RepID=A0A1I0X8Z3_9FIRM|nr:acyl carrier protein [Acetitomaculum ruminis]SFA97391.1 Phosphopantetheine attachment site [Acetitomaculum ruminis DSM 5522]